MLIPHRGHADTIQVYSVTVMTHVTALQAGHSSQGTSEPITPAMSLRTVWGYMVKSAKCNFHLCYQYHLFVISIYSIKLMNALNRNISFPMFHSFIVWLKKIVLI